MQKQFGTSSDEQKRTSRTEKRKKRCDESLQTYKTYKLECLVQSF